MTLKFEKPAKRGPKPRARLRHSSKPVARRSKLKRGKAPRRMKRGKTAEMRREAERLMRRIVLADGLCVYLYRSLDGVGYCGQPATDCAHVLAKGRHASIRYNVKNGLPLCRYHHDELGSAKLAGPCPMRNLYVALMGRAAWEELLTAASKRRPPMSVILNELKAEAKDKGVEC